MSADYEAEQERLKLEIEVTEEWVEQQNEMNDGLDAFIALTKKYVDVTELTPTIVNEYIKKIEVFAPDKSSGKRRHRINLRTQKNGVTFRSHRLLSLFVAK